MIPGKYVRFDWAAKTLLRDKSNFGVLEGLISVLLNEKVEIEEILESESNRTEVRDKFNRVDVKARNSKGEIIIVEVQQDSECDFLGRILYGVSKSIIEHISHGEDYGKIKKIYSVNILYFNFGKGADYLYHGRTVFTGVNTHDTLQITTKQQNALEIRPPGGAFPRILHHPGERVRQGGEYAVGGVARLSEERPHQGRHHDVGFGGGALSCGT